MKVVLPPEQVLEGISETKEQYIARPLPQKFQVFCSVI
jgi:hypothetical protein